ncbi:cupin domain-containing protein [Ottowia sp.]|uniref:cupin domain-containing protein n=1 Tax=Ottowia sp. TaxID=1898956 RepID=UPI0039E6F649
MLRSFLPLAAAALLAAGCASQPDVRHVTAPEKNAGIDGGAPVGTVDMAAHKMAGSPGDYELRARLLTIAPGGGAAPHPHAGQPGIVRVIKGTIVEGRGSAQRVLKAGDYWFENADTTHWFRNPSTTEPAELWAVDVVPKKKP